MHIAIENLSFNYTDGHAALSDISIFIPHGEHVAIVGPNGAGKSTLLLHLNGILRGKGKIIIDGLELTDKTLPDIRRKVGLIFQDPNDQLFCPTVYDDVAFGPLHFNLGGEELDTIVKRSLTQVSMQDAQKRPAHHLSLGERKRVSIAAVLACSPEVLVFDEPTSMLDPRCRRELCTFIKHSDKTVIVATHDPSFALETTTRCLLINEGRIVCDGATNKILNDKELLLKNGL
jgi:energy-coupling factor transporter ATP-binding protein EcfA2